MTSTSIPPAAPLWKKAMLKIVIFGITTLVLLYTSIPLVISLVLSALLTLIAGRSTSAGYTALMLSVSIGTALLIGEMVLRSIPPGKSPHYYRPHEYLQQCCSPGGVRYYKKNSDIVFDMPHGDLAAFIGTAGGGASESMGLVVEPRSVRFVTDETGRRNSESFSDQQYLLLGDSLVAGNGTTQDEILSEVMTRDFGAKFYNLGHAGGIAHYKKVLNEFKARYQVNRDVFLFIFEGNDMPMDRNCMEEMRRMYAEDATNPLVGALFNQAGTAKQKQSLPFLNKSEVYRLLYSLRKRIAALVSNNYLALTPIVTIKQINSRYVAFYNPYIIETVNKTECKSWQRSAQLIRSVKDNLKIIVFIPTKYRIYEGVASDGAGKLPSVKSDYLRALASTIGVKYLDLTDDLVGGAQKLMADGRFVYWRDDTHWNGEGISIASKSIKAFLEEAEEE